MRGHCTAPLSRGMQNRASRGYSLRSSPQELLPGRFLQGLLPRAFAFLTASALPGSAYPSARQILLIGSCVPHCAPDFITSRAGEALDAGPGRHEILVAPRAGDGPHATANCVCVCASSCLCVCARSKSARKSCLPWSDQRSDSTAWFQTPVFLEFSLYARACPRAEVRPR